MAVFSDLRLVSLLVLMLVSQLDVSSAAVRVSGFYAQRLTGDILKQPDPFVKVWCGTGVLLTFAGQTEFIFNNKNPVWSAEFNFPNCKANDNLKIEVWDRDLTYDDLLANFFKVLQKKTTSEAWVLGTGGNLYFTLEVK